MIVTYKIPHEDGELRIGWASWDDGSLTQRSIKYAYKDKSGKISRGSPELPFEMLLDMIGVAIEKEELSFLKRIPQPLPIDKASTTDLLSERKTLTASMAALLKINHDLPWVDIRSVYDSIGARYEDIKKALATLRESPDAA